MMTRTALISAIGGVALLASAAPSLAQELVPCARENGFCRTPYPTTVVYGVRGATTAQEVGRGIPCNNRVFGDPAPGVVKQCWFVARGAISRGPRAGGDYDGGYNWRPCASEGQVCSFNGTRTVRYGANGRFVERLARNGILCGNPAFGRDPAKGNTKTCYVRD